MKIVTGIDLLEIDRMKKSIENPRFLKRVFSEREIQWFESGTLRVESLAANFCAKEAVSKAIGTGIRGFSLNEISVLRDELGKPYFVFEGSAERVIGQSKFQFDVSLTHTDQTAGAVVVGIRE